MRVLIDNCVPKRLASAIAGHNVACVVDLGWGALPDGTLLDRIANEHDALVTVDRNIRHQQRLDSRPFCVVVLRARTNRLADLLPLIPALLDVLGRAEPGKVYEIDAPLSRA